MGGIHRQQSTSLWWSTEPDSVREWAIYMGLMASIVSNHNSRAIIHKAVGIKYLVVIIDEHL